MGEMDEMGVSQHKTEGERVGLYVILVLYSILFLTCLLRVSMFYRQEGSSLTRSKLFVFILSTILLSKFYTVRIAWILDMFFRYPSTLYYLLDYLPSATLFLLGSTFFLIWSQIYISTTQTISPSRKKVYLTCFVVFYFVFNFLNYFFHVMVVISYSKGKSLLISGSSFLTLVVTNAVFSFITASLLYFSARTLWIHIQVIFSGETGYSIAKRIKVISLVSGVSFLLKSVLPLALLPLNDNFTGSFSFDIFFVLFYYGVMEVLPVGAVLLIVKAKRPMEEEEEVHESIFSHNKSAYSSIVDSQEKYELRRKLIKMGDEPVTLTLTETYLFDRNNSVI